MPAKKRKISGLSGPELRMARNYLVELRHKMHKEVSEDTAPDETPEGFEEQLDSIIEMMETKVNKFQVGHAITVYKNLTSLSLSCSR
jgi:hypothetical protein